MNPVVTSPRHRKARTRRGAILRAKSGSMPLAWEEFNATDGARALPAGSAGPSSRRAESGHRCAGATELDRLHDSLKGVTPESHPRTARLLGSGTRKAAQKVIEEAGEVALEAVKHDVGAVVRESADLLFHLVVLWRRTGIAPAEVWTEMRRRADLFGIAEKLPKVAHRQSLAPQSDR